MHVSARATAKTTRVGRRKCTAATISAAVPNNPVYLVRVDGHAGLANAKAMQLAGLSASTQDPAGGHIDHIIEGLNRVLDITVPIGMSMMAAVSA